MRNTLTPRALPGPADRIRRALWTLVWALLYWPSPTPLHAWRRFLLRSFGARVGKGAHPYPGARIWAPWNLTMNEDSCLADGVQCYCVDRIVLGAGGIVSQRAFLCAASHDYRQPNFPLVTAPIMIGPKCWIAAEAFVGPGVTIGEGAVVAARAVVISDVASWAVVAGNPAQQVSTRRENS